MEITLSEAAKSIKTKGHFYNILSRLYYLPDFSSKAITKDYLLKYTFEPIPIFVMKKETVIHHHFEFRKYSSLELLELLEELLRANNKKPTGLSIFNLPDQEWLKNAILNVDSSDPYELLKKKGGDEDNFTIQVNEE